MSAKLHPVSTVGGSFGGRTGIRNFGTAPGNNPHGRPKGTMNCVAPVIPGLNVDMAPSTDLYSNISTKLMAPLLKLSLQPSLASGETTSESGGLALSLLPIMTLRSRQTQDVYSFSSPD